MKKKHLNKDYNVYKVQDLIRAYSKLIGCDNPIQNKIFKKCVNFSYISRFFPFMPLFFLVF